MMATTHALVGCAIASTVPNPLLAGILIVSSHYMMDLLPHWDFGTDWKARSVAQTGMFAIADTLIGFFLSFLLFSARLDPLTIFLAASLSNLPDWIQSPWFLFFAKPGEEKPDSNASIIKKMFFVIYKVPETYLHTKATFPYGVYTQIGVVAFFFLLLLP